MPLFMSTFGYKPEVWADLIKSPENREETVREILEQAGCKLKGLWYAFGEDDGFALIEAPDTVSAAAIAIAIGSSADWIARSISFASCAGKPPARRSTMRSRRCGP